MFSRPWLIIIVLLILTLACLCAEEPQGQRIIVEATAYCPCKICTPGHQKTFNGNSTNDYPYGLAGDRRHFKLGIEVYIPTGQGVLDKTVFTRLFLLDDRGSALDSEATKQIPRLDIRFKYHNSAVKFGRKLIVIVLNPRWPSTHEETLRILGVSPYYKVK